MCCIMMLVAKPKLISSVTFNISTFTSWGDYRSCIGGAVDVESVVSSWRRIAPWCCLVDGAEENILQTSHGFYYSATVGLIC